MASRGAEHPSKRRRITMDDEVVSHAHEFSDSNALSETSALTRRPQKLYAFEERESSLRAVITCKICFGLMYEPYTLGCGHTYCYDCLGKWFDNGPVKTCPDCRAAVSYIPAPAYALREMVREMLSKPHLLPAGESIEEHERIKMEHATQVEVDKADTDPVSGGLFQGRFRMIRMRQDAPRWDEEDHVFRCPNCAHELESRAGCGHCEWASGLEAESDSDGESLSASELEELEMQELDYFEDMDDPHRDYELFGGDMDAMDAWGLPGGGLPFDPPADDYSDEPNEEDDDTDTSLDGFVVGDEAEVDGSDSDGSENSAESTATTVPVHTAGFTTATQLPRIHTARRVIDSDDEETSDASNDEASVKDDDDDSSSDDSEEVADRRCANHVHAMSSASESEGESGSESEDESVSDSSRSMDPSRTPAPHAPHVNLVSESEEESSSGVEYESDEPVGHTSQTQVRNTIARLRAQRPGNRVQVQSPSRRQMSQRSHRAMSQANSRRLARGYSPISLSSGTETDDSGA